MDQYIDQDREGEIRNQQMAAAAFFFQKTDQYIANERSKLKKGHQSSKFLHNFHKVISSSLPSLPPCLQKNISSKSASGAHRKESDKIQVFVQLIPCAESSSCISIDKSNNSITVTDPTPSRKFTASNAPKSFPVDSVISEDWPLVEICSNTLNNVIRSVANGEDACVLSFGNVSSSEQNPMLGSDKSASKLGIIPCAILWLFNYINIIRQHENSRFSVRISATEVSEKQEICRDLLAKVTNTTGDGSMVGAFTPTNTPVELRAVDAEKASFYLDYALSERSKSESMGLSHMLLTLHLYQYHMENESGISGGRSRLHLIDLGHGRLSENIESNALSIQGISKVIMALWSGQRHLPNSESCLTQLLQRVIMTSNGRMQTSMLFNISGKEVQYNEALQIVQLASKIYRQKIKSSKLSSSSSIISDDNSSSDSFSLRRMTKTRERRDVIRRCDRASYSSDFDATSSSEVSCDTVIYRGLRSDSPPVADRGSADGSSQDQVKCAQAEIDDKKPEAKLTLFQQKRRNSIRTNSNAWPKIAVKKALQAMKSGQELWVDGPQAMYPDSSSVDRTDLKMAEISSGLDPLRHPTTLEDCFDKDNPDNSAKRTKAIVKSGEKGRLAQMFMKMSEHQVKTKPGVDKYGSESVLKSNMVTDWLSKQPEISEEGDLDILYAKISSRKHTVNKPEVDSSLNCIKNNQKMKRDQIEANERKMSSKKHSQIEEWIKSVSTDNSGVAASPRDVDVVMTQSLYSPTCSPYHTSHNYPTSFSPIPFSPPSAPLSYNANSYDCGGLPGHAASIGSEIENECSRLWSVPQHTNDKCILQSFEPFDDLNNIRSSSYSSAIPKGMQRIEPIRRSCHKNLSNNPLNFEIPRMQHETLMLQGTSGRYSTLPLDLYSPRHNRDSHKSIAPDSTDATNPSQICDIMLKTTAGDAKRSHKDLKKKETKKVFSFFNQLIRNKKQKKEVAACRTRKEESTNKPETSAADNMSQLIGNKQTECHLSDSVDYVRRAGPPLVLSSPYHMITSPKAFNTRADSSGHGSDCSSFNGVKAAQVSVNFHPETTSFRFAAVHRAGSSGYESVVRDSELSSHNDSASDCSATRNIPLQSPTGQKHIVNISTAAVATPSTTTLSQSLSNNERDKQQYLFYAQESQKVSELILKEKFNILKLEREEVINDLISTMKFYNIDPETSRKDLDKNINDMDGGDQSLESLKSTNQMLRSVLNRYQSNICVLTSFLSKPESEYLCE